MAIFCSVLKSLEFSVVVIVYAGQLTFLASERYDVKSVSTFSALKVMTKDGALVSLRASL